MIDLWRLVAIADLLVVFSCGYYLHAVFSGFLPRVLTWANYAMAGLLILVAASVCANAAASLPPTVGVKIFASGAALCALALLWLSARVARGKH